MRLQPQLDVHNYLHGSQYRCCEAFVLYGAGTMSRPDLLDYKKDN